MLILALLACAEKAPVDTLAAGVFWPAEGRRFELAPLDQPDAEPWELRVEEGEWRMRIGDRWADATQLGTWPYEADPGLIVGESRLLPDRVEVGEAQAGATVESIDAGTVWYGTFDEVATVTVEEGDWAGEARFAKGLGPIALTLRGELRELVYYE